MLKLEQVKLEPGQPEELLAGKAAHMLRIPTEDILDLSVLRRAVDARQPLRLVYTLRCMCVVKRPCCAGAGIKA